MKEAEHEEQSLNQKKENRRHLWNEAQKSGEVE